MIALRIMTGLVAAVVGLGALTQWRAAARETAALAASPPTGQFLDIDGYRLHYEISGTGPDLVLIHGASGSLRDMTFSLRDRLTDRYRVIVLDRPGLGHSDPIPEASLRAQAIHIAAGLADLGVTRPIVLGQSYGGAVALALAMAAEQDEASGVRPRALVLVSSPSLPWPGSLGGWYRVTSNVAGRAIAVPLVAAFVPDSFVRQSIDAVFAPDPVPAGYDDWLVSGMILRRSALRANTAQVNALREELVEMQARYPELAVPVELVHGSADTVVPLDIHSGPLSRLLPDVTLTVIDGAGHMPHHSHPDIVIAAIDRAALR